MSRLRRNLMRLDRYYHDVVYIAKFSLKVDTYSASKGPGIGFMLGLGNARNAVGLDDRTGYYRVSVKLNIKLKITERSTGTVIYSNKFIYDHPKHFSTAMRFSVNQHTTIHWNVHKDIWDNTSSTIAITPNTEYWIIYGDYPLLDNDIYDVELVVSAPNQIAALVPGGILDKDSNTNEIIYISSYHTEDSKAKISCNCLNKVDFVSPDPTTTNKGILISISKHSQAEG